MVWPLVFGVPLQEWDGAGGGLEWETHGVGFSAVEEEGFGWGGKVEEDEDRSDLWGEERLHQFHIESVIPY